MSDADNITEFTGTPIELAEDSLRVDHGTTVSCAKSVWHKNMRNKVKNRRERYPGLLHLFRPIPYLDMAGTTLFGMILHPHFILPFLLPPFRCLPLQDILISLTIASQHLQYPCWNPLDQSLGQPGQLRCNACSFQVHDIVITKHDIVITKHDVVITERNFWSYKSMTQSICHDL